MGHTQDRFLEAVRQAAEGHGLDYRCDPDYANTGHVSIYRERDDFGEPLLRFSYQFSGPEYQSFTGLPGGREANYRYTAQTALAVIRETLAEAVAK